MKDDSLTPVFNLRGCEFTDLNVSNTDNSSIPYKVKDPSTGKLQTYYLERDVFLSSEKNLTNTFGVFKNPSQTSNTMIQGNKETKP